MLNKFTSVALVALANVQSIKGTIDSEQNQLRGAGGSRGNKHRQLFINTAHMGGPRNARSSDLYSTIPYGEGLKTVGEKFTISPDDKFDQAPASGFGHADLLSKLLEMKSKNYAEAAAWAEEHLGGDSNHDMMIERLVVPTPKQSLVDKELTVIATESIVPPSHPVFCHEAEVNKWFCHESHDTTDITKVTVTTENSNVPSVVWAACHDEEQYWCHIINVGDNIFVPKDKNDNNMNAFPSVASSSCDAFANQLTKDIKTALEDTDVLKNLCQEVDASTIESELINVLTEHNSLCLDELKVTLLENMHHIKSTYDDSIKCVPELTKEKMLIEPYLAATVCGAECLGLAPALISGLHADTGKGFAIENAVAMEEKA